MPGDCFESSRDQFFGFQVCSVCVLVPQRAQRVAGLQIGERTGLGICEFHRIGRITPEIGRGCVNRDGLRNRGRAS